MKLRSTMEREECTRDPIFIFEVARYHYFHDKIADTDLVFNEDCFEDPETKDVITDDELVSRELAARYWAAETVFYTREEGETYGMRRKYKFGEPGKGWRVWCVCAEGQLGQILNTHEKIILGTITEKCKECGHENKAGSVQCTYCGKGIKPKVS